MLILKPVLFLLLTCIHVALIGQTFEPRMLDVKSMQEELDFFQNKLNTIHPEAYHHISKESFNERLNKLRNSLQPLSTEQWYVKLAALTASLHDGHTCLLYNSDERQRYLKDGGTVLPFFVQMSDDRRITIWHQFTGDSMLVSSDIQEMNGRPIEEILYKMTNLTFGESEVFKNSQITRSFGRMYWLLNGHCDSVLLTVQLKNGTKKTQKYKCLSETEHDKSVKKDFPRVENRVNYHMELTISENGRIALLTLNDFMTYKGFKDSIAAVFKTIKEKGVDTLFFDIRDNGGGEHNITESINHYLLDTAWVLVSKAKIKMSNEFYTAFPKSVRWLARILPKKPSLKLAAATMTRNTKIRKIVKSRDPISREAVYDIYTRPRKHYSKKHLFKGKVFLFTDRNSYSMSGMFAAILKDYKRALIVGEETGGLANPHGSNVSITLPHSKFVFTVSTSRAYRPSGVFDNHGVMPDIAVPYNKLRRARGIDDLLQLLDVTKSTP